MVQRRAKKDGRIAADDEAPADVVFASRVDCSYITGEVRTPLGGEQRAAWRSKCVKPASLSGM
jgi:hypothetical protein